MIVDLTTDERERIEALDDGYNKLLKEQEAKVDALRPNDTGPDMEEYERLQKSRPKEPPKPEPIEIIKAGATYKVKGVDGVVREEVADRDIPIYPSSYRDSPEYKAYEAENKRINDAIDRNYNEWYNAGSDEWKAARKRYFKIEKERTEAISAIWKKAEDRQFNALGGIPENILEDAYDQATRLIVNTYQHYQDVRKKGTFSAIDVRAQGDGGFFLLDTTKMRKRIKGALSRHYKALSDTPDLIQKLDEYIESALRESEYVGDTGELFGEVKKDETTLVAKPTKYSTTVDKISGLVFSNGITKPHDAEKGAVYEIVLGGSGRHEVKANAVLNYDELLNSKAVKSVPVLTDFDYTVYDAIVTHILSGNRLITVNMIYRVITGKINGNDTPSEGIYQKIKAAIRKFDGRLFIEFPYIDSDTGEQRLFRIDEHLLDYTWIEDVDIHGHNAQGAVSIPIDRDPALLKWARMNGNEIDTRDISLRNIPRLNNGDESATIRDYLYRRVIAMRNAYDRSQREHKAFRMSRKIKLDTIYQKLGLSNPDKNKRRLIKGKVERCLSYWKKKELIADYNYTRKKGSNQFDGIEIEFIRHETTEKKSKPQAES